MSNRYWVGGTANWDSTAGTKWALTDGGAGGQAVPTDSDDVFFTAASGAVTVSVGSGGGTCKDLNFTGFTGTINHTASNFKVYGSLTFVSGMTYGAGADTQFFGTGSHTITTAGKTIGGLQFLGTGTYTLQDDVNLDTNSSIDLTAGTLTVGAHNINGAAFSSTGTSARVLNMGSGLWTLSGVLANRWYITGSNMTLNKETANIKITTSNTGSNYKFYGLGFTYNDVWIVTNNSGGGSFTFDGSNTFGELKIESSGTANFKFTDGTTQTVTSLATVGNSITLTGTSTGGWGILDTSGTNSVSNCSISYSNATGGATWIAPLADGNIDSGNNTGWSFGNPIVTTEAVSNIIGTTAVGNGTVVFDGGFTITERGICWNSTGTPTTSDNKIIVSGTTGVFSALITGLEHSKTYYVRAYATNSVGTSYGTEVNFLSYPITQWSYDSASSSPTWSYNSKTRVDVPLARETDDDILLESGDALVSEYTGQIWGETTRNSTTWSLPIKN